MLRLCGCWRFWDGPTEHNLHQLLAAIKNHRAVCYNTSAGQLCRNVCTGFLMSVWLLVPVCQPVRLGGLGSSSRLVGLFDAVAMFSVRSQSTAVSFPVILLLLILTSLLHMFMSSGGDGNFSSQNTFSRRVEHLQKSILKSFANKQTKKCKKTRTSK